MVRPSLATVLLSVGKDRVLGILFGLEGFCESLFKRKIFASENGGKLR